jgi:hypothetical protein
MDKARRTGDCLCTHTYSDVFDEVPCDLMIRRKAAMFTPVVFFNKTLPSVLSCISRELNTHRAEQNLSLNLYGIITTGESSPLSAWYQSILQNIYDIRSPHQQITKKVDRNTEAFYLQGDIFTPMDLSSYQYVTLTLPPLWQKNRNSGDQDTGVSLSHTLINKGITESGLFGFQYCQDTNTWYASQARSLSMKQILE